MRRSIALVVVLVAGGALAGCAGAERAAPEPAQPLEASPPAAEAFAAEPPVVEPPAAVPPQASPPAAAAALPDSSAPAPAPSVPTPSAIAPCARPPQPAVDGPLSASWAVAEQQLRRAVFGLASDVDTVRRVAAELPVTPDQLPPEAVDFYSGFGIPVTVEEAVELARRQKAHGRAAPRLEQYGQRFPNTFAGVWLYWDDGGGVAIAFADDVAEREAEIAALELGVPVRVVEARYAQAELDRIAEAVRGALTQEGLAFGTSVDVLANVVAVYASTDPSVSALLAGVAPTDAVCLSGSSAGDDPSVEESQPQSGDGWRLLADEPGRGPVWVVRVATGEGRYERLWRELGVDGERPAVDFGRELVIQLSPAVSGSCSEIVLAGLLVERGVVRPDIRLPASAAGGCTDDANPHTYLVAVSRDRLPGMRFRVQLEDDLCPGCDGTDVVDVDLGGAIPEAERALIACVDRWNGTDNAQLRARVAVLSPEDASVWRFGPGESPAPGESAGAGCAILLGTGESARLAVRSDAQDAFGRWELFAAGAASPPGGEPGAASVWKVGEEATLVAAP